MQALSHNTPRGSSSKPLIYKEFFAHKKVNKIKRLARALCEFFFGNISQKKFEKILDAGPGMCLRFAKSGAVMRLILICARRAPQYVLLGIFSNLPKITLDFDARFEYNYLKLRNIQ